MKRLIGILLTILLLVGCILPAAGEETAVEARVTEILEGMSLRQKITQMMMIDFRNWNGGGFTVMNDQVRNIVEEYQFGAVIYFAPNMVNTKQVYELTKEMQTAATQNGGVPMIITADQEGATCIVLPPARLFPAIWPWVPPPPPNMPKWQGKSLAGNCPLWG